MASSSEPDPPTASCDDGPATTMQSCIATLDAYDARVGQSRPALARFARYIDGESVFCIGNGPSLLSHDPRAFAGRNVICTNLACRFLAGVRLAFRANVVTDATRLVEVAPDLAASGWPTFVAPHVATRASLAALAAQPAFIAMPTGHCVVRERGGWAIAGRDTATCNFDLAQELEQCGKSVIFAAVQLAVYVGATTIVLVGVDMDYSGPQTHFLPQLRHLNQSFDYDTHARNAFVMFRRRLEARGIRLVNATAGGRVDVLERSPLASALASARHQDRIGREWRASQACAAELRSQLQQCVDRLQRTTTALQGSRREVARWREVAAELTEWRARYLAGEVERRAATRSIYLWGDNPIARRARELLEARGRAVAGVVDQRGGDAITPEQFQGRLAPRGDVFVVICAHGSRAEIAGSLRGMGLDPDTSFISLPGQDAHA